MSSFVLKLIAIITMLIDHIGAVLYPEIRWLRLIGRIAFPIFPYFVAEGFYKTSDVKKYLKRLFIFALISQVPFYLAFKEPTHLNIFFTLFISLYAISKYDDTKNNIYIVLSGLVAELIGADYGFYGVLTVFIFYKHHYDFKNMVKNQILLNIIYSGLNVIGYMVIGGNIGIIKILNLSLQSFSLVSLILIWFYNGKRGFNLKYLFYTFYPVHIFILYLIDKFKG